MARGEGGGQAALVAAAIAAALVRFHGLGSLPLSTAEASGAVIAWDIARGAGAPQPADPAWATLSPLLASLQFVLFGLLGAASEWAARAPSALAGTALVLCPWMLRRWLGVPPALVLACLIALDPACVEMSRRAEGAALAALLGAVVLVAAWHAGDDSHRTAGAVALGLLLVAGPSAWSVAPVVIVAWVVHLGPRAVAARLRGLALPAAAAGLAGASGLLGAWGLVGGVSAGLTAWLSAWSDPRAGLALQIATLIRDPLVSLLSILGLLCLARERRPAALAAFGATLWWTTRTAPSLVVFVLIAAAVPVVHEVQRRRIEVAPGALWRQAASIAFLATLALVGVASTVRIAAPGLETRTPGSAGMDLLARDVERLSSERAGDPHELPVEVVCQTWPDPLLRWSLRDARHIRFHLGSPDPDDRGPALVIGPEPSPTAELACQAPPARSGALYQAVPSRLVLWVPREG